MTDLTKIEKPFGLLDAETQEALQAHGGPYECFASNGEWSEGEPLWCAHYVYRVKPQPPKPREWWGFCNSLHDTREKAEASLAALRAEHGDIFDGIAVFHVREVIPE